MCYGDVDPRLRSTITQTQKKNWWYFIKFYYWYADKISVYFKVGNVRILARMSYMFYYFYICFVCCCYCFDLKILDLKIARFFYNLHTQLLLLFFFKCRRGSYWYKCESYLILINGPWIFKYSIRCIVCATC